MNLDNYKWTKFSYQPSKRVSNCIKDIDEFNEIIAYCQSYPIQYELTEHGAIRIGLFVQNGWCWDNKNDVSKNTFGIILIENGRLYQFTFWPGKSEKEEQGIKSNIDQTTKQINAITQDLTNITDILNKFNEQELTNLIDTINTKQQVVSQLQESFNNLSKMIKYTQIKVPQLYDTTDLVKQSTYYTQLKEDYNKYLVNQSKVNINLPDEKTFDLKENPYTQDYNSYKQLLRDIQDYETSLNNYDAQISNLEKEKAKIKVCPTCGRPLED